MQSAQVVVEFLAKTQGLANGLKEVQNSTEGANKGLGKLNFKSVVKWAAGAAALGAGAKFVKDATKETIDLAKASMQVSRTTGLDIETSSKWVTVLKSRGIETGTFNKSMVTLSKQMTAASSGSKRSSAAFEKLGVSMADVRAGNTQEVLLQAADGLSKIQNPAERAALAQQLFGKAGQQLLPILMGGREGIESQLNMAEKYGATISGKTAKQVADMAAKQREMGIAFTGVKVQLGTALIPLLLTLATVLVEVVRVMQPIITNGNLMKVMLGALVIAFVAFKVAAIAATVAASPLIAVIGAISAPVWIVIAAIVALIAIGVLLYKNWETVQSVAATVWNAIQAGASAVLGWLKSNWPLVVGILLGPVGVAAALIYKNWDAIRSATTAAWNAILKFLSSILSSIQSAISSAWNAIQSAITGSLNAIRSVVQAGWSAIQSLISAAHSAITAATAAAWAAIRAAVTNPIATLEAAVRAVWNAIKATVDAVDNALKSTVTSAWNAIKTTVSSAATAVQSAVTAAWHAVQAVIQAVVAPISAAIHAVAALFSQPAQAAGQARDAIKSAMNDVLGFLNGLIGRVSAAATGIANAIKAPINAVISAWNSLTFTVPTVRIPGFPGVKVKGKEIIPGWGGTTIGGGSWSFPSLPRLARGGVLDRPTLFVGGERGREIVTPESLLRSIISDQRPEIRVYIGETELRGIVRTEVISANNRTAQTLLAGLG